jgi:hypothetical protein
VTNKLKPALFYALHRSVYGIGGYKVVAVTTYKERRGRWFGRYVDDNTATHGASDLQGRFDTPEAAKAAIAGLVEIQKRHEGPIKAARRSYDAAQHAERDEVDAYLKGLPR